MVADRAERPLVLWGLVSANIFATRGVQDFYLALTPFFEPFIQDFDGRVLNIIDLKRYAESRLMLALTDDVCDIFVARMEKIGWLQVIANDAGAKIYRCKFSGSKIAPNEYADAEGQLTRLVDGFRTYLRSQGVALATEDSRVIEDQFLSLLSRRAMSDTNESGDGAEAGKAEYWIAKYIGSLSQTDRALFEFAQQITGIALLSEALVELRNPSESVEKARGLVIFLDGPLLMNHLGLSGKRAKDNASYIVEKLRDAGAVIACFRHSCDEVRDNLAAVLARAPYERTGPTAEAMRNGEVQESFVSSIRNNVEHFAKTLGRVQVIPARIDQFKSAEKYCDNALHLRLAMSMPAQGDLARERDANSIAIIMRRRQGHETSDFCDAKFVLVTSNEMLVRRSNEVLRQYRALGSDKAIIGPAIHHRLVGAILFANFGLTEKKELSRRQLLATCARVVMLRPKVLERLREQIAVLNRPEEAAVVDALLSQPRASEILMDYTAGNSRAISSSNIEEVLSAVKRASAEEIRLEYEQKVHEERLAASVQIEEASKQLKNALQEERTRREANEKVHQKEKEQTVERIRFLEGKLAALAKLDESREEERRRDFDQMLTTGVLAAQAAVRRIARREVFALTGCFVLLAALFVVPAVFVDNFLAKALTFGGAGISALATAFFVWNRPVTAVDRFFERRASAAVRKELLLLKLEYLHRYFRIDYKSRTVSIDINQNTKSTDRTTHNKLQVQSKV